MGTSGSSDGPNSRTPLVPSWLGDEPREGPADGDGVPPSDGNQPASPDHAEPLSPLPPPPPPGRFTASRRNFSTFAGSSGRDGRALRRAVRDYVRWGTRGSSNATRRMGASRATARGVLGVFRDFQRDGLNQTLIRFSLSELVGRPLEDVFIGLTDVICGERRLD
jgi:hypothetical protein